MRFLRRSLTGLFLLALTLGLLAYAAATLRSAIDARLAARPKAPPSAERVFSVNVIPLHPRTVTPELTAFGEIRSRRSLELRAEASGRVVYLHPAFEEGGRVAAGDLLLRVDPADATSARDLARADLSQSEAELRDAEKRLELAHDELAATELQAGLRQKALGRQKDLRGRGVGTDAAVEEAELTAAAADQAVVSRRQALAQAEIGLETATTALARARIALADAGRALADTELRAAFSGTLIDVSLVEGGLVGANERVADLIDVSALEAGVRVSTAEFSRLLDESGALRPLPVTVTLDVYGANLTARGGLSRESGAVPEDQVGRLVYARLEAAPGFRPGDFVTLRVEEPALDDVMVLPASALDAAGEILVLDAGDRLVSVPVTLLRREGDRVIIRAPELAGREAVAERSPLLGAGIKVRPLRPGAAAGPDAATEATVELSPERRAALIAFVETSPALPQEARARIRAQLDRPLVPAQLVERLETRMGG
ncbi:efflux RND transporter periplasmic adaptor subunit [Rhodovulum sulfidophilum]|uniref:efflux RND transporter periplasmic adaptor subunit n=1 Tax=Rhodovulum sulfidophilum TaxID=35806 RepID=UPI001923423E|nr:efflux RND transporter periplasmic adaptor subunit [Rhodovulum sulfidophilum]MBL3573450.1 efflux transporter periplasmic adaptor subunit [Rhodovulum sulfidophilum]MCE8432019.1 efflux RND transporter periplasmic adaptor subunit [Rhodovulum sulfidophilum]MCF4117389.1 efflux RND transporter periplasmic adaptor subunit [Rhodovulum sulfidophilum]